MCIAVPMQVQSADSGRAWCRGRGELRLVTTLLVGDLAPGEWVLVFKDSAVERIDAARAAEVDSALDLLAAAMAGSPEAGAAPEFALPSAQSAEALAGLLGAPPAPASEYQ